MDFFFTGDFTNNLNQYKISWRFSLPLLTPIEISLDNSILSKSQTPEKLEYVVKYFTLRKWYHS